MPLYLCLIGLALAYTVAGESSDPPNRCPQPTSSNPTPSSHYYGHPGNCSIYYTCANGTPYKFSCQSGTVWSDQYLTCVTFNSDLDTCTRSAEQKVCDSKRGQLYLIPHSTSCAVYYNCSNTDTPSNISRLVEYQEECSYPYIFDVIELKCKSYEEGNCGPNKVPAKDVCDYLKNRCRSPECEPCYERWPSCVGKTDGMHEHPYKRWSIYFIVCDTERLHSIRTCADLNPTSSKVIFDPDKKECVERKDVPRRYGGLAK